jgi:hypothetical protein
MPWRTCRPMDERLRFVARLLEGEKMAPLCREFGISRVTGYKIFAERSKAAVLKDGSAKGEIAARIQRVMARVEPLDASRSDPLCAFLNRPAPA